jgi:peptidoglycan hydrolase CwlO-like protein
MWDKIGVALAVTLPLSGVILTIALKVIYSKKREVLPYCAEKFKKLDAEIGAMKKSDTDRQNIVTAVQAAIEMLKGTIDEQKKNSRELYAAINENSKETAVILENIKHMSRAVEEIRKNGKKNHKE